MPGRRKPFAGERSPTKWRKHLGTPGGATSGTRWQRGPPRKPLKQADPQPVATHGNRFAAHGKEGVDGSSPSEGSAKVPLTEGVRSEGVCSSSCVRWVWSRLWNFQARESASLRV